MGDAIVDDAQRVMSEAGFTQEETKCPSCGSRKVFVSYGNEFIADLNAETSEPAIGNSPDPYNITCFECGELIWEA